MLSKRKKRPVRGEGQELALRWSKYPSKTIVARRVALKNASRIALTLTVLVLCVAQFASAAGRTVTESYVGSFDPLTYGRCRAGVLDQNIGKICFEVNSLETKAVITTADQAFGEIGFFYIMKDANGNCVGDSPDPLGTCPGANSVCGHKTVSLLKGTVELDIYPSNVLGIVDCTGGGTPVIGGSATGTVKIVFS